MERRLSASASPPPLAAKPPVPPAPLASKDIASSFNSMNLQNGSSGAPPWPASYGSSEFNSPSSPQYRSSYSAQPLQHNIPPPPPHLNTPSSNRTYSAQTQRQGSTFLPPPPPPPPVPPQPSPANATHDPYASLEMFNSSPYSGHNQAPPTQPYGNYGEQRQQPYPTPPPPPPQQQYQQPPQLPGYGLPPPPPPVNYQHGQQPPANYQPPTQGYSQGYGR